MARNFDGTNDNIAFGSDASIDELHVAGATLAFWLKLGATTAGMMLATKSTASQWFVSTITGPLLRFRDQWSGSSLSINGSTTLSTTVPQYIVIDYNGSSVSNRPNMYVDGNDETETTQVDPVAPRALDAALNLMIGEVSGGTGDLNGQIGWFIYDDRVWDAAQRNRARWWGRPDGVCTLMHPFTTNKLANEGNGVGDGTASGTTVVSMVCPVVRPGTALMGMGIGW